MRKLNRRLQRLEESDSDNVSFDMLTVADEPIGRKDIETDTQKFIQVPTPFGMALKQVDADHPHGRTKQQHLEIGNDIAFEVQ